MYISENLGFLNSCSENKFPNGNTEENIFLPKNLELNCEQEAVR